MMRLTASALNGQSHCTSGACPRSAIAQTKLDELALRVARGEGYSPVDEKIVLAEARQRLGDLMRVRFEYVYAIERTLTGRFRFIVSQLP